MTICVVGSGYVGLVTAACFADSGQTVVAADVDKAKIARLEKLEIPIFEPGLEAIVARNVAEGRLRFTSDVRGAVSDATAVFVAVGTPSRADGGADLGHVDSVASLGWTPKKSTSAWPVAFIANQFGAVRMKPNSELLAVNCVRP